MELDPKAVAERIDYVLRYGGRCRECADNFGVCPASGLPCTVDDAKRAIRHVLEAIAYGKKHGYLTASRSGETGWPADQVPIPQNADQAVLMNLLSGEWIYRNAPERLSKSALRWYRARDLRIDKFAAAPIPTQEPKP